jgi:hypothetical protein
MNRAATHGCFFRLRIIQRAPVTIDAKTAAPWWGCRAQELPHHVA